MSPTHMDADTNLILCWDRISGHDLRHPNAAVRVSGPFGPALAPAGQLAYACRRPAARALRLSAIGQGGFPVRRRLQVRQIESERPLRPRTPESVAPRPQHPPSTPRLSTGWQRPLPRDQAGLGVVASGGPCPSRPGLPVEPPFVGRGFAGRLTRTVLHLAPFCLAGADLRLEGIDRLKSKHPASDGLLTDYSMRRARRGPAGRMPPVRAASLPAGGPRPGWGPRPSAPSTRGSIPTRCSTARGDLRRFFAELARATRSYRPSPGADRGQVQVEVELSVASKAPI